MLWSEREREREGLSAVFFISIGDCLVVFDPIPFSIACLPHAVSALSLSLSRSLTLSGQLHARRLD